MCELLKRSVSSPSKSSCLWQEHKGAHLVSHMSSQWSPCQRLLNFWLHKQLWLLMGGLFHSGSKTPLSPHLPPVFPKLGTADTDSIRGHTGLKCQLVNDCSRYWGLAATGWTQPNICGSHFHLSWPLQYLPHTWRAQHVHECLEHYYEVFSWPWFWEHRHCVSQGKCNHSQRCFVIAKSWRVFNHVIPGQVFLHP